MARSDRPEYGSVSSDSETTDDSSGVGRRRLLGGMAAGVAAPFVADAAVPGGDVFDSVAAAGRDPTEDWTSSPVNGEINSVTNQRGYLIARTAGAFAAVDQSSGDRLWRWSSENQSFDLRIHQDRPFVVDGRTLLSLDSSGNERWSIRFDGGVTFEVQGDTGYVAAGGTLQALSLADGSTQWSVEPENLDDVENVTENRVVTTEGGFDTDIVAAYDRSNGSEVWRKEVASEANRTVTSFGEERIYYGYGSTLDALSVSDGSLLWSREFEDTLPFVFPLTGTAYLLKSEKMAELSPDDGSEVWTLAFEGFPFPTDLLGADLFEGPDQATVDGMIVTTQTTVQAISLDGTRLWSYETENTESRSVANAVGDLVYATDGDRLVELDAGEQTWTYDNDDTSLRTVTADDQRVYTNDTGRIYAFKHGAGGGGGETTTTAGGGGGTTTAGGGGGTTTAGGGGGTTTAGGGGGTTTAGGGGGTTTAGGGDGTTVPSDGTTAGTGTDAATTEATGGDDTATEGDSDDDSDGDSGQTPGFGVLTALAAALLAATRLLGDDEEDEE